MNRHDCIIVWLRQDLRIADNPALGAAVRAGKTVLPVFILDEDDPWAPGAASRWWLHGSLEALRRALESRGSGLLLRRGPAGAALNDLIEKTGATAVIWNRLYEPWAHRRDRAIKRSLEARGIRVETFNARLLAEPGEIATASGGPFRVFTPFWKAISSKIDQARPLPAPPTLPPTPKGPAGEPLSAWQLQPSRPDWAGGLRRAWKTGEAAASAHLDRFLEGAAADYKTGRNRPGVAGTSRLSPHLHWGEISPRQVWHRVQTRMAAGELCADTGWAFLRELGWREFSAHLLHHFPDLPEKNFNRRFDAFPWRDDKAAFVQWQKGETGYPIVDAGMRELWTTGWMHNRVRMVTASFLVKHLLIHWREGESWFWDTLVDADLANNAASWQWVAGSGADAAPYFRIFNPVLQGEKFDAKGAYVRQWLPELASLPDKYLHKPWAAPETILKNAGIRLGKTYPEPMVDHKAARDRALSAFAEIKTVQAA